MVQMVMRRRGKTLPQPVACKTTRHGLYGQVPMGGKQDLADGECQQYLAVERHHQQGQWCHQAVDECLDGVQGIRRLRRRAARAVVQ